MTETTGLIGTGVIGIGWAARLLSHGRKVSAWDPSPDFDKRLVASLKRLWPTLERQGLEEGASIDNLTIASSLEALCDGVSFIQESAPEDLSIKQSLLGRIDRASDPAALILSSSSGLLPTDLQTDLQHPERVLIGHPFNPVYLLPLVEIVAGKGTDPRVVSRATAYYERIGMRPLVVRNEIEGYLSDRLQEALWREILHLVNDGVATTAELDAAITDGPGLRWALMGTCLTFHLAGGDGGMRHMLEQFGPALKKPWTKLEAPELTPALIDAMVEGTSGQAGDHSIAELEQARDECLIELMEVVDRYRARIR